MKTTWAIRIAIAIILAIVLVLWFSVNDWLWERVYPLHYEQQIRLHAEQHHLDPYLVAAVIRVESNYRPHMVSSKGA